jgi:hypothetical protein
MPSAYSLDKVNTATARAEWCLFLNKVDSFPERNFTARAFYHFILSECLENSKIFRIFAETKNI